MSQISVQNNVNIVDVNTKNNQVLVTDPTLPTTVTIDNTITEVVEVITPGPQGPPGDPSIFTSSFVNIDVYNEFTSSYNTGSFTGSFTGDLIGTASFATSASFASTSSIALIPPTLQQVLDFNRDLVDGVFNAGTGAGEGNTGINQNALGEKAGFFNTGNNQNALGEGAGFFNTGNNQNALGESAGFKNAGNNQNALGEGAGAGNTGENQNALGASAGVDNTGDNQNAIGRGAGLGNTGVNQNALGEGAGLGNTGDNQNAIGSEAGFDNSGQNQNAFGNAAGFENTGNDVNAFGSRAGNSNVYNNVNLFGNNAEATADGQTVLSKDGTIMARIDTANLTDSRKYDLPDNSGIIALTSDLVSYVPYTGATQNVNLGNNSITASNFIGTASFATSASFAFTSSIALNIPTNTSQLINDGEDGNSPYVTANQLPSNLNLFATNVISDVPSYFKLVTSIDDPDYNTIPVDISTGAITTTNQFIASLVTSAGVLLGNPGIVNLTTVGNIRKVSGTGVAEFYYEVYHRDSGGIETLIATSNATPPVNVSVYTEFIALALLNNGTFLPTDRIVVKYYGNRISGGSNPTYEFQFGGLAPVRTLFPVPASNLPIFPTKTSDLINDGANGIDPFITILDIPYQISKHTNLASFPLTGNDAFVYLAEDTGLFYLWNGISGTYDQITNNVFPTGLERITEGAKTGWRLIGRNPANYGDIGNEAVDISISNSSSTTRGSIGNQSFCTGLNNSSSGNRSFSQGTENISSGVASVSLGERNFSRSNSELSIGHWGTDYTPVGAGTAATNTTDRVFNIGNGLGDSFRSNAFTVFKNGALRIFRATLASITNAASGFFIFNSGDNNRPYIHNGTKWHGLEYKKEVKVVAGTTYTLVEEDADKILHFTNNSDVTLTIPTGLSPTNRYEGKQLGDGQILFGTDVGVDLRVGASELAKTAEKYSVFGLDVIGTEEYMLFGKLELS
jgi:hypothetical protein